MKIAEPHSPEFTQFLLLHERLGLKAFRTELCVYHSGLDVAGQIDCLCMGERGLEIWERRKIMRKLVLSIRGCHSHVHLRGLEEMQGNPDGCLPPDEISDPPPPGQQLLSLCAPIEHLPVYP